MPSRAEDPRDELLIHRALDGVASPDEWDDLERSVATDPVVGTRLARTLRAESELRLHATTALSVADSIELPTSPPAHSSGRRPTRTRVLAMAGWAAAILLAVLWGGSSLRAPDSPAIENDASTPPELDAESAFDRYLVAGAREGRVLRELPRQVMETRPVAEQPGGLEVVYVRRLLERTIVDQFYELGEDDLGRPASIPVSTARLTDYGTF